MKKIIFFVIIILILSGCVKQMVQINENREEIDLPKPKLDSDFSVERALSGRRSIRSFKDEALSLEDLSQLLWAAQGIDAVTGATRTAPSAGATQPLEVYFFAKNVNGLEKGIYHYNPEEQSIDTVSNEELKTYFYDAPLFIVLAADYQRTTERYGSNGARYVNIEAGHAAQNIHLQALGLGLGSFPIGAFDEGDMEQLVIKEEPLYVICVGKV